MLDTTSSCARDTGSDGRVYLGQSIVLAALSLCRLGKCLLKVRDDVVDMLSSDRDANEIFGNAGRLLFIIRELLVGCRPRMNGKSFGVANTIVSNIKTTDLLGKV